jgi:hypothetical protein
MKQCYIIDTKNKKYSIEQITITFPRKFVWTATRANAAIVLSKDNLKIGSGYKLQIDNITLVCSVIKSEQIDSRTCYIWLVGGDATHNDLPKEKQLVGPTVRQVC